LNCYIVYATVESMFNFMYKCITHYYLLVNQINNKIVEKAKSNKKLNFNRTSS